MLTVTKGQGFMYQEVDSITVFDVLVSWCVLAGLICFVVALFLAHSDNKDPFNQEHGTFGPKTLLAAGLIVIALGSPFMSWALAVDNTEIEQNATDKKSIAQDYDVEVISVKNSDKRNDKSTDEVAIKNAIVKVDNAIIECQHYVITASDRYYVTCGENTPLEDLVS